jgi:hypothetical protein
MKKLGRLLLPIVIAVVLGPLAAGLMFCLLAVFTFVFDQTGGLPLADLLTIFGVYIVFAYIEGGAIALLAGVLVSIWMIWRPPGVVVAIVAATAAIGLFRLAAELGFLSPSGGSLVRNNLTLALVVAVIAAGVCWLLTRRFARAA